MRWTNPISTSCWRALDNQRAARLKCGLLRRQFPFFSHNPQIVMLRLDPSIFLATAVAGMRIFSGLCAARDARVEPEHDVERPATRQSENCCLLRRAAE